MQYIILLLFVILLGTIGYVLKATNKLGGTVLLSSILSLVFGVITQNIVSAEQLSFILNNWTNLFGNGYTKLLQMIVMPLVLVSILSDIAKWEKVDSLGKISISVIGIILFTTAIAALITIIITDLFGLTSEGLTHGAAESAAIFRVEQRVEKV